ncbi:hypothetical protein AeRB84_001135 [Aphanomyces euteiches]|nr:hypothetical protein AeRB84_001135 [Aphanomyces euteiches]
MPTSSRKKYEEVMLLPRKELQKMDLSPPKRAKASPPREPDGGLRSQKQKEFSESENEAIWRRWKAKKDAERRKACQERPMDDIPLPNMDDTKAQFLKWKKRKDEERRRQKLAQREQQAEWEREKETHLQELQAKRQTTALPTSHISTTKHKIDPARLLFVQEQA